MTTTTIPRTTRDAFLEDIEWMLGSGEHPDRIATRLHTTRNTIARRLLRTGRADLARHFHHHPDRAAS